jgi:methanogenic corrinoid protein MtbC1
LRKQKKMSQIDLANSLGVSQTSIAHYEKGDRQPTIETLMSISSLFDVSIDELVGNKREKKESKNQISYEELYSKLSLKDEVSFMKLVSTLTAHHSFEVIIESYLRNLLYDIGNDWERGKITEADEHYASYIVRRALISISSTYQSVLKRKKAVTLAVQPEQHTLGIEMVSTYLESQGVETLYLGSNLPIRSLKKLITEYGPNYVFISMTLKEHYNSLETILESIYQPDKYQIAVGGQAIDSVKQQVDNRFNLIYLHDMDQVLEMIK